MLSGFPLLAFFTFTGGGRGVDDPLRWRAAEKEEESLNIGDDESTRIGSG
jgi:hypothetical protein